MNNNIEIRSSCCHAPVTQKTVEIANGEADYLSVCTQCGDVNCGTIEWDPETEAEKRVESAEEYEHND